MTPTFRRNLTAACTLMLLCTVATGDEPAKPSLPAQGAWASFHLSQTIEGKDEETGHFEIRFLEKTIENNQDYLWIEFVIWFPSLEQPERGTVIKLLVPEAKLQTAPSPLASALRGYSATMNASKEPEQIVEVTDVEGFQEYDYSVGTLLQALPMRRDTGKITNGQKQFDVQSGRLMCNEKLSGERTRTISGNQVTVDFSIIQKYDFWLNDQSPFGFAEFRFQLLRAFEDEKIPLLNLTLTIQDFGTGAKSELPEKK